MSDRTDRLGVSPPVVVLIFALVGVQVCLAIVALIDLWRRDRVAGGRKWLWALLILVGNLAGPVLYLAIGRDVPPEADEPAPRAEVDGLSHSERIRRGVDELYGATPR